MKKNTFCFNYRHNIQKYWSRKALIDTTSNAKKNTFLRVYNTLKLTV